MKMKIEGIEYPVASLGKLSLFDLLELKKQTGMDVEQMQDALSHVDQGGGGVGLLSSGDGLIALGALIWLTRRKSGDTDLTFEAACDFPLDQLEFVEEEGDEAPAADPS